MMRGFYPHKRIEYEERYLVPARKFLEFSRGEILVFIDVFRKFDLDASGTIDATELGLLFQELGQGVSAEEVDEIIEQYDEDRSGEIEFNEFLQIMRGFYPSKLDEFQREFIDCTRDFVEFSRAEIDIFIQCFREFDLDDSGTIDAKELELALNSMGQGCSGDDARDLIESLSESESNSIDWKHFFMIMREFYPDQRREFEAEFITPARSLFPHFSRTDLLVFVEAFREFDADGSGTIDVHELANLFKSMGQGTNRNRLQEIIDKVDDRGMGEIGWSGFLKIMDILYPDMKQKYEQTYYVPAKDFPEFTREDIDVFIQTFRECDIDGSGSIDVNELAEVFSRMGQGCSREKLQMIIDAVDDDGLGEIKFDGFLKIMKILYPEKKAPAKETTTTTRSPSKQSSQPPNTQSSTRPPMKQNNPPPQQQQQQVQLKPVAKPLSSSTEVETGSSSPSTSTTTASPSSSPSGTKKCASCGKTVYPVELINALSTSWHKGCFKCQAEGCGITLNLKTFKGSNGKIYCNKHVPAPKMAQQNMN